MTHAPSLPLRQGRLQRLLGPDFIVAVHEEANCVWVTPKTAYKPPPKPRDDYFGFDGGWA